MTLEEALNYLGINYKYYKKDTKDAPKGMFDNMLNAMKTLEDAKEVLEILKKSIVFDDNNIITFETNNEKVRKVIENYV